MTIGSNLAFRTSEHLDVAHGDHGANEIGGESVEIGVGTHESGSGSVGLQLGIRCQKSQTYLQVPEVGCVEFCGRGDIQVRRVVASRWTQR